MEKKEQKKKSKKPVSATVSVFLILGLTFFLLSLSSKEGTYFPLGISFLAVGIADLFDSRRGKRE